MAAQQDLDASAAGLAPGCDEKRDGVRTSPDPALPDSTQTAPGGSPGRASSGPTVAQLQQVETMLRGGHHPDHVTLTTGVPPERVQQMQRALLSTRRPRR